jgi:hypothetical protein
VKPRRPTLTPPCFDCKHFRGPTEDGYNCEAFPDGIPTPILLIERSHHEPYPGDHGIRFEPIEK